MQSFSPLFSPVPNPISYTPLVDITISISQIPRGHACLQSDCANTFLPKGSVHHADMAPFCRLFFYSFVPVLWIECDGKGDGEAAIGPTKVDFLRSDNRRSDDEANLVKRYMALVNRCDYRKPFVNASVSSLL